MHFTEPPVYNIPFANPKLKILYMDNSGSSEMGGAGAAASSAANARWNPTKEQIGILEGLYKQGVRTPTAEQIQQITARLRAYGHIEGKNVFYWFQNHKARQRQRERQESLAFLNRCFHRPLGPPPPPPLHHLSPCPSVVCRPYYVPQSDQFGVYPAAAAASQVVVPCGFKRRQRSDLIDERRENKNLREHRDEGGIYNTVDQKTTLELFPLLPMNNPKQDEDESIVSVQHKPSHQRSTTSDQIENHKHQPFFDFFTNKTTCSEY